MSNIEHLIENALTAMEENPKDTYQAFKEEIRKTYNQQMLKVVSITESELWEIAQYIVYTWIPNLSSKDFIPHGKWIAQDESLTKFSCSHCKARNYDGHEKFCPNCGARMKGGESDEI